MEDLACHTDIVDHKTYGTILSRFSRRERFDIDSNV
jgi:hypothetical protein